MGTTPKKKGPIPDWFNKDLAQEICFYLSAHTVSEEELKSKFWEYSPTVFQRHLDLMRGEEIIYALEASGKKGRLYQLNPEYNWDIDGGVVR